MEPIESTLAAQQFPPLGPVQVLVGAKWQKGLLIERMKEPGRYYGWRFLGRVAVGEQRLDVPLANMRAA